MRTGCGKEEKEEYTWKERKVEERGRDKRSECYVGNVRGRKKAERDTWKRRKGRKGHEGGGKEDEEKRQRIEKHEK